MTRPLPQLTPDTAVGEAATPTIAHTHPPGLREAPAPRLCSRLARKRAIGKLAVCRCGAEAESGAGPGEGLCSAAAVLSPNRGGEEPARPAAAVRLCSADSGPRPQRRGSCPPGGAEERRSP